MSVTLLVLFLGCADSGSEEEIGELRERIAVLEAQSSGTGTTQVDLSDIESRLALLESGLAQTNDNISQIETEIENIKSTYATSDDLTLVAEDIAQVDQRVATLETSISGIQSSVDDLATRTSTLESGYDLLSQEVDTVSASVVDIQSHVPQTFQVSGTYGAYISSNALTTLSGSELAMVIPNAGLVNFMGSISVTSSYCGGYMTVDLIDSTNAVLGTGSTASFSTNLYSNSSTVIAIGSVLVPSAGNYTARIRYNGGSAGAGYCTLTTYQTNASFVSNP